MRSSMVKPHAVGSHTISTIHLATTQSCSTVCQFLAHWDDDQNQWKPWTLFAKRDWPFTSMPKLISNHQFLQLWSWSSCGIPTASGRSLASSYCCSMMITAKGSGTPKGREPLSLLWKPDFKCKFSIDLVVNARYCSSRRLKWMAPSPTSNSR